MAGLPAQMKSPLLDYLDSMTFSLSTIKIQN